VSHLLPPDDLAALDLPPDVMRAMGHAVVDRAVDHLAAIPTMPSRGDVAAEALCRTLRAGAPETGRALEPLLDELFERCVPPSFTTIGAGYLAYIPGGGIYPAALADFIADTTNRFTGIWQAAPALVQLEANVLDWLREWMGFPDTARGLFTTGGSMATFNAIAAARERHLGPDIRRGTLYVSSQAHHCVQKAAKLAGIAADRVREIPVDAAYRMRVDALAEAIVSDRAAGLTPFFICSTAGTTNTGAVDPLEAIADLAAREECWHHIDGAYGACFHLVPRCGPSSQASRAPTRSPSTRTRASSSRTGRARSSCATVRRCAPCTPPPPAISPRTRGSSTTPRSTAPTSRATSPGSGSG
jgi:aromatic-L-amino-acid decarboxylase